MSADSLSSFGTRLPVLLDVDKEAFNSVDATSISVFRISHVKTASSHQITSSLKTSFIVTECNYSPIVCTG